MRKTMFVSDFSNYARSKHPRQILFASADQAGSIKHSLPQFYFVFYTIEVCDNSNKIKLIAKNGEMEIDHIDRILVDEDESLLGTVLSIYCGQNSAPYTLCLCE